MKRSGVSEEQINGILNEHEAAASCADLCRKPGMPSGTFHARFGYRGEDVVATLDRVCRQIGYPATIRIDQGSEFISRDMDLWACQRGVTLDFSRPGRPTDNAFIEAFNGRFRAESLNSHWVMGLADAIEKTEAWRRDCNEERPHGTIGNKVPAELMKSAHAASPCV